MPSNKNLALSSLGRALACRFCQVTLGFLSDRLHMTAAILVSTVGATIPVLFLWELCASFPIHYIFSLVSGLFGGGFTSSYTSSIQEVERVDGHAEAGLVFGRWLQEGGRGA